MYRTINGYTRESMKAAIRKYNNGKRAVNMYGTCMYSNSEGNRCAVGCFMDLALGGADMDDGVAFLLSEYPEQEKRMPLELEGLSEMQAVHDNYTKAPDIRDVLCDWIDNNVIDGTEN